MASESEEHDWVGAEEEDEKKKKGGLVSIYHPDS